MRRDMAIRHRGQTLAYVPGELSTYLFSRHYSNLIVDFDEADGVPRHLAGVPNALEVRSWIRDNRRCMLAYQYGDKGHWIGFDGFMVNNLSVWGQPDQLGWDDFAGNLKIDKDLWGVTSYGSQLCPRMAVLIA